jgi:hypothetical protein
MHVEMPKIGHDEQVRILVREQALIARCGSLPTKFPNSGNAL